MKIGIDLYSFDKPGNNFGVGPGVYAWSILPEIIEQSPNDFFYIFTNRENLEFIPNYSNIKIIIDTLPIKYRFLRIIHEQLVIPFWYFYYKIDFVHFFGNNISYILYKKSILTVLDLMWKYYLDFGIKSLKYKYVGLTVPISIKISNGVITISNYIAKEIAEKRLRSKPCFPILLAPGKMVNNPNDPISSHILELSKQLYIYSVTTSMPHKNLTVLLNAFNNLVNDSNFNCKLIISGQLKGDFKLNTFKFIKDNNLANKVFLTGFVSESEKQLLYKNSLMVVYPSLYEGFGLPILEAMYFNTPVIASNAASIPEVGGQACLYFNPKSVQELQDQILMLSSNKNIREELISEGAKQLRKFSWAKAAKETISVYRNLYK
jgi:glycosyltransferase involved in cell wall biosynthesis